MKGFCIWGFIYSHFKHKNTWRIVIYSPSSPTEVLAACKDPPALGCSAKMSQSFPLLSACEIRSMSPVFYPNPGSREFQIFHAAASWVFYVLSAHSLVPFLRDPSFHGPLRHRGPSPFRGPILYPLSSRLEKCERADDVVTYLWMIWRLDHNGGPRDVGPKRWTCCTR